MFYGIYNILDLTETNNGQTPPSAEAILDQSIHLIMLGLVERPQTVSSLAVFKSIEPIKRNLLDVLCLLESHVKFKAYKARIDWILSRITEYQPLEVQARRQISTPSQEIDPEEAKKRAARARQEALMRQMKAQQASFATKIDFDEDMEDDDFEDTESPISFGSCIVCQEPLNNAKAFGSLGFMQPSRLLRRYPDSQQSYMAEVLTCPDSLDVNVDHVQQCASTRLPSWCVGSLLFPDCNIISRCNFASRSNFI